VLDCAEGNPRSLAPTRDSYDDDSRRDQVPHGHPRDIDASRPVTQCTGASKWVPTCSAVDMSFQYQAGPRSSVPADLLQRKRLRVGENGGGNLITGVAAERSAVRSTIFLRCRRRQRVQGRLARSSVSPGAQPMKPAKARC